MQVLWKDKKRQQRAYSLLQKNSRQTFMMNDCCNYTCQKVCDVLSQGQSINDVIHFLRFFTLPSPLSPILGLWNNITLWQIPPPPKWLTSFMDGPSASYSDS